MYTVTSARPVDTNVPSRTTTIRIDFFIAHILSLADRLEANPAVQALARQCGVAI